MDKEEQKRKAKEIMVGGWLRDMTQTEGWKYFLGLMSEKGKMLNDVRQIDTSQSEKKVVAAVMGRQYAIKVLLQLAEEVDALIDQGKESNKELKENK